MANWYYKLGDQAIGPMDAKQLKQLAASNRLQPDDLVRMGEDSEWVPAIRVKGLFSTPVATAVPVEAVKPESASSSAVSGSSSGVFDMDFSQKSRTKKPDLNIPVASPIPASPPQDPVPVSSKPVESVSFDFASPGKSGISKPGASKTSASVAKPGTAAPKPGAGSKNASAAPSELSPADIKALKKKKQQQMTILLGGVCGVGIVILLGVIVFFSSGKKPQSSDEPTEVASSAGPENAAESSVNTVSQANAEAPVAEVNAADPAAEGTDVAGVAESEVAATAKRVDASKEAAKFGDLEVKVRSIKRGKPVWEPIPGKNSRLKDADSESIIIELSVVNSNPTKLGTFISWSSVIARNGKVPCTLKDNNTPPNSYSCKNKSGFVYKNVDPQSQELIAGDSPVIDVLVFGRLVPQFDYLELKLNDPTGGKGEPAVFQIPKSMIGVAPSTADSDDSEAAKEDSNEGGLQQETGSPQDLVPEERGIPLEDDESMDNSDASSTAPDTAENTADSGESSGKGSGKGSDSDPGLSEEEKAFASDLGGLLEDEPANSSGLNITPEMRAQAEQMEKERDAQRNAENREKLKNAKKNK